MFYQNPSACPVDIIQVALNVTVSFKPLPLNSGDEDFDKRLKFFVPGTMVYYWPLTGANNLLGDNK
jgi:hypothetical protein